jgi:hypothetical protein
MTGSRRRLLAVPVLACCLVHLAACGGTQGMTVPGRDTRTVIRLSAKEREHLRLGMRIFLESVQGIVDGAKRNDMAQVARSAERSGMGMIEDISFSDAVSLPPEFLIMSIDTHQKFDALSRAAVDGGTKAGALERLGGILANCTACHTMYRLAR